MQLAGRETCRFHTHSQEGATMTRRQHRVEVSRVVAADAATAFAWVADPRTHPRFIPLTVCAERTLEAPHEGLAFTMLSGPGIRRHGRGIVDRMVVIELRPPTADGVGRTRVRKVGPVLLGESGFDVVAIDRGRSRVVWWEEAYLAGPWPRRLNQRLVGVALRIMLHVSLRRLGREIVKAHE
jgi:hypothetical protein